MKIELSSLTLRYDTTTAVDDLSLTLDGPGIVGLLGRNGAGKTSLLSVLAAFRPATTGTVLLDGVPVWENPSATRRICFIRGSGDTVTSDWPEDRVHHAFAFAARFRPNWDDDVASKLADRFQLPTDQRLNALSRGQRSVVGIILGLAARAPLTIFDESYLGLDAAARQAFYDAVLAEQIEHPRTFILSTHLIDEVAGLFEHVVIIDEGRLLLHEDADELRARGASLTGDADAVDGVTAGLTILGTRQLGKTKEVTVFGELDDGARARAQRAGVQIGTVGIQDLFIHLTEKAPS